MRKSHRKLISRIIARVYLLTKNDSLRLALINISTKILINGDNHVEYDSIHKLYWLKNGEEYLLSVKDPYFYFNKDIFEERALKIFCQHYIPKNGDVIINVGAGIGEEVGFFTRKIQETGKLYNIEASPSSFRKLQILTQNNNLVNCSNFNLGISNCNGEIWTEETENYLKNKTNKKAKGVKVPCYTLDQFVADNNINRINLLKVNIEGAEFHMIDGMEDSIDIIQNVAISCHDFLDKNANGKIWNKVNRFLIGNNFDVFHLNTGNEILDSWVYGVKRNEKTIIRS